MCNASVPNVNVSLSAAVGAVKVVSALDGGDNMVEEAHLLAVENVTQKT